MLQLLVTNCGNIPPKTTMKSKLNDKLENVDLEYNFSVFSLASLLMSNISKY